MRQTIEGKFVVDGYSGLREATNRQTLNGLIDAAYGRGAEVVVKVTLERVGQREFCKEKTKYGRCNEYLNADGTCHSEDNHVVPEPDDEYKITRVERAEISG